MSIEDEKWRKMDLTDSTILPSYLTAFSQGIIILVITVRRSDGTSTLRVISFLGQWIVPEQLRRYKWRSQIAHDYGVVFFLSRGPAICDFKRFLRSFAFYCIKTIVCYSWSLCVSEEEINWQINWVGTFAICISDCEKCKSPWKVFDIIKSVNN